MNLPFRDAAEAIGARILSVQFAPPFLRVVTDTRSLRAGDTFLALAGERFDGHAYTHEAAARGAVALIVERAEAAVDGVTTLIVERALAAYLQLARLARQLFRGEVLAITGSAGKTTTKAFALQLLQLRFGARVLAAPGNENNEIGVSKLILNAGNEQHDALVVEMGARHFGDIGVLVDVARPHVGILTNIGDAHLEIMGSRERLEETKWSLFSLGARPILNFDDEASRRRAPEVAQPVHWFYAGVQDEDLPPVDRVSALLGSALVDKANGAVRRAKSGVDLPGAHNRANAAAAIAGALELGVPFQEIAGALPGLQLPEGRYQRTALDSGAVAIFDAYNANAAGTLAALDAFAREPAARRIAILGSMAELGDEAAALHERVGARAGESVDILLTGGDFAESLARGARRAGLSSERIVRFATNDGASAWLRENAREGDVILLKGSRKYALEEVLQDLRA